MQGAWVQSLVRELDPLGAIKNSHATAKSLHAATYYCCTWKFVPFEQRHPIASLQLLAATNLLSCFWEADFIS